MHVPENKLFQYRNIMRIARTLDSLGDTVSGLSTNSGMMSDDEGKVDANTLWALGNKYRARAQRLRVPGRRELDRWAKELADANPDGRVLVEKILERKRKSLEERTDDHSQV